MKRKRFLRTVISLLCIILFLSGCRTCSEPLINAADTLANHERKVVSKPANAGAVIGGVVGIPVAIILSPVTMWMPSRDPYAGVFGSPLIYPIAITSAGGAVLLGGSSWLLFGWWGESGTNNTGDPIGIEPLIAEGTLPHHRTYGSRIRRFGRSRL